MSKTYNKSENLFSTDLNVVKEEIERLVADYKFRRKLDNLYYYQFRFDFCNGTTAIILN